MKSRMDSISRLAAAISHATQIKTENLPPDTPSTFRINQSIYFTARRAPKHTIADLDAEITKLKTLQANVEQFHAECDDFTRECDSKLNSLSIFKPDTWKTLLVETIDRLFIFLFGPIFSFGTITIAKAHITELSECIDDRLLERTPLVIEALKEHKGLKTIEACSILGKITPHDTSHLHALGERLVYEGAYSYAVNLLKTYTEAHPDNHGAKLLYITALKSSQQFEKARHEIEKLARLPHPFGKELHSLQVECLVGLGRVDEAKSALRDRSYQDENTAKKMLFLLANEDFDPNHCKALFQGFESVREMVLQGEKESVEVDFWIHLLQTQSDAMKVLVGFISAAKNIAHTCVTDRISHAISILKDEAAAENARFEKQTASEVPISDPALKKALEDGYNTLHQQILHGGASPFFAKGLVHKKAVLHEILSQLESLDSFDVTELHKLKEALLHISI